MANQAAFYFLLASTCSILLLLPRGELWRSSATSLLRKQPTFANVSSSSLRFRGRHTHHTPFPLILTASIVRCHLLFKLHIMPVLAFPSTHLPVKDFGGTAADSGLSVATAATGFSTGSPFLSKQSLALKLQRLHTPPSAFPTCSGLRSLTKTQEIAEQKALKDLKGKAAEEKKLAALARKADAQAKRQARLISSAKAKAAKAAAKANEARLKLAEPQAGALTTPSSHLHKKSKGVSGTPSSTSVGKAAVGVYMQAMIIRSVS